MKHKWIINLCFDLPDDMLLNIEHGSGIGLTPLDPSKAKATDVGCWNCCVPLTPSTLEIPCPGTPMDGADVKAALERVRAQKDTLAQGGSDE